MKKIILAAICSIFAISIWTGIGFYYGHNFGFDHAMMYSDAIFARAGAEPDVIIGYNMVMLYEKDQFIGYIKRYYAKGPAAPEDLTIEIKKQSNGY